MASTGRGDVPPVPALTVAAVARRLGVAPATLRTWDRRYGLGPGTHTAGAHRRYTPADVSRLGVMRRLTLEGVAPVEAARVALATPVAADAVPDDAAASVTSLPVADGGGVRPRAGGPGAEAGAPPGGGRVVAVPDGGPAARGLARAATSLDSTACAEILRSHLDRLGVVPTWDGLLVPVLDGIGRRWETTGQGVDVEHLLSECVMGALRAVTVRLRQPANSRPILLACAEEEQHSLPLHVLAAALSERQVSARVLGARVPRDALAAAVRRSGPAAVVVWSQLDATGAGDQLAALPTVRPAPLLLAGGPGWQRAELPRGTVAPSTLGHAVEVLVRATGI